MQPTPKTHQEKLTATAEIQIPFHRASVGEEEARAVSEVVRSGWLTTGTKTLEFEDRFAKYVGARHAVAVSSGTAALHLSLEAIGLRSKDEVLIPTNTFTSTGEVVTYCGGRPVLVDIDPVTLNMDPDDIKRKVTPQTRALIPVHIAGQPCDMDKIQCIADEHRLHVIEDAAHALPSTYRGRKIGCLSKITAFSFYATKTLTTGEGGMITTDNDDYAARMRIMRLHGITSDAWKRYGKNGSWFYEVLEAGFKYNLTDLQAALGLVQLAKCDALTDTRRSIAERYSRAFKEIAPLEPPIIKGDRTTSWHLYILRLRLEQLRIDRKAFIQELKDLGIGTSVHFIPLHLHPYYQRAYGYRNGDLPVAEAEFQRCLSLPIYPGMSDGDIEQVIHNVAKVAFHSKR